MVSRNTCNKVVLSMKLDLGDAEYDAGPDVDDIQVVVKTCTMIKMRGIWWKGLSTERLCDDQLLYPFYEQSVF